MKLYTSNIYLQSRTCSNEEYLNAIDKNNFEQILCDYAGYYVFSPQSNKNMFQKNIELEVDIPIELLMKSNFVPFYILNENPNYNQFEYFIEANKFIANEKKFPLENFYIQKSLFDSTFVTNVY